MESEIKNLLKSSILKGTGQVGGGYISDGEVYLIDNGKVFVKKNSKSKAREMFDGEFASLKALEDTETIKVPKPIAVVDNPEGGAALIMEYINIKILHKKSNLLGKQLARLHLLNIELEEKKKTQSHNVGEEENLTPIYNFGFHTKTSCGYIAQDNTWHAEWPNFYARKLQEQMSLIEKEYGDREAIQLWSDLNRKIPEFFVNIEIKPSLLHGDLWSGNAGEVNNSPVVFDPASFYGHHEYDLAIAGMFGGFNKAFWDSYHDVIPKTDGWDQRHKLYLLFHHLNHWNHFGSGYRSGSLDIMRSLTR